MAKRKVIRRKKRFTYIKVKYFYSDNEYTYKSKILNLKRDDFVVVPTVRGNTVARVEEVDVEKPDFVCKLVINKVDLEG